jgi:hypothetical protein
MSAENRRRTLRSPPRISVVRDRQTVVRSVEKHYHVTKLALRCIYLCIPTTVAESPPAAAAPAAVHDMVGKRQGRICEDCSAGDFQFGNGGRTSDSGGKFGKLLR